MAVYKKILHGGRDAERTLAHGMLKFRCLGAAHAVAADWPAEISVCEGTSRVEIREVVSARKTWVWSDYVGRVVNPCVERGGDVGTIGGENGGADLGRGG